MSRARCSGCDVLLGGAVPAYRWTWLGPYARQWPLTGRPLLCARCCAEWRRWQREDADPLPYTVRSV